jgi:phage terminase Nu1 subunit (DNA packaging protein)
MAENVDLAALTVTRQELATLLGLSSARIGQMVGEGIIPAATGHGCYLLAECVKRYCEHTRADSRSKGSRRFVDARSQWMESKARKAKLEEEVFTERFIEVSAMNTAWQAIGTILRTNYLRVPSRLASRFAEFKTPQGLFDAATEEINLVLEALNKSDGSELNYLFSDEAPGEDKIETES